MSIPDKNKNFSKKTDYQIRLIKFNRAVNAQSDIFRKAYVKQISKPKQTPVPQLDKASSQLSPEPSIYFS